LEYATILVDQKGLIAVVEKEETLMQHSWYQEATFEKDIDASDMSVIPGLVDSHTHPIWDGDRVHEFAMKLAGATYMDIHNAGGGIRYTVQHTRESTVERLESSLKHRLDRMLQQGTTLMEAKSGYALEKDGELQLLRILTKIAKQHPIEISTTYLGAHTIPKGRSSSDYVKDIIDNHLPALKASIDEGEIRVDNIDVFHEHHVFETEETRKILCAGHRMGLHVNFHGDQLHPMNSAELAAEIDATAVSHLEEISDQGIRAMAQKSIVAILLPSTAYILRIPPPPARKMIDAGVPVALGSDFNPNAHCLSMPFIMNLACVLMQMTMNEVLVAATLNAAASLHRSHLHGSIEVGKYANFVLIGHNNWQHLIYELVDPPIAAIIVQGHPLSLKKSS
jgi:imidazolonepropionase